MSDKQIWALIVDNRVRQLSATDPAGLYPPDWCWQPVPDALSSVIDTGWSWSADAGFAPADLTALRQQRLRAMHEAVDAAAAALTAGVSQTEQQTWPTQLAEALELGRYGPDGTPDYATAAPLLTLMAAQRGLGETVPELAARVLAAAARYTAAAGQLVAWSQCTERELVAAADAEALMSVSITSPTL